MIARLRSIAAALPEGGIAAVFGGDDSPALHMEDTLVAGAGLYARRSRRSVNLDDPIHTGRVERDHARVVVSEPACLGSADDARPSTKRDGGESLRGTLLLVDSVVLAATTNRQMLAFHRESGRRHWDQRFGNAVTTTVLYDNNTVYAATDERDGELSALNTARGRRQWKRGANPRPPRVRASRRRFASCSPRTTR